MGATIKNYLEHVPEGREVLSLEEFESTDSRIFGLMPTEHSFISNIMDYAKEIGYEPHFLMRRTFTEAAVTGSIIGRLATNVEHEGMPFKAPCILLLTGEMLVAVEKNDGVGGRNQEFAISISEIIKHSKRIVSVSVDTDGTDGPGGFFNEEAFSLGCDCLAGGIVDGYTYEEDQSLGINLKNALHTHNKSYALWRLNSGIWTVHNISVQDLVFILIMDHDGKGVDSSGED
jgi:glycerate-2-kinase